MVQELNVYRPLLDNALEQLREGRVVLAEVDSYFLPDTAGTDYRSQHTKTTIGIQELDAEARTLGYYHNSSYHWLAGEDFLGVFCDATSREPGFMPFYAEFVRTERVQRHSPPDLVRRSIELLKRHLKTSPAGNPASRFATRIDADIGRLRQEGLAAYHAYAFATIRQLGAAFELGALYLHWLAGHGEGGLDGSVAAFTAISDSSKALILKGARAVATDKAITLRPMVLDIAHRWTQGTELLARRYGV